MKTNMQDIATEKSVFQDAKSQTAHTILMVEPVAFGFNEQTAVNNYFQQRNNASASEIQEVALYEFRKMVEKLRANGINVLVVKDTEQPLKPDSIFPNNWISFHEGGQAVLYPMFAKNRRYERRNDIIKLIEDKGTVINNVDDFAFWEEQNMFLEGTGSMVFDRIHKIAYACLSERTDKNLFLQFCKVFDFRPVYFTANQSVAGKRVPVYHTNVMMCIGAEFVVVCAESVDNEYERRKVIRSLKESDREVILITEHQMNCFAGNMLQVENGAGKHFLVLSQTAFDSLDESQVKLLEFYNELIVIPIPTIEKVGGGSVRCMMAEIF